MFVQQARKIKQLYQKDVADMAGITQAYYSRIESGDRQVTLPVALSICAALNLDFNDFLKSLNKKKARVNRPEIENNPPV